MYAEEIEHGFAKSIKIFSSGRLILDITDFEIRRRKLVSKITRWNSRFAHGQYGGNSVVYGIDFDAGDCAYLMPVNYFDDVDCLGRAIKPMRVQ